MGLVCFKCESTNLALVQITWDKNVTQLDVDTGRITNDTEIVDNGMTDDFIQCNDCGEQYVYDTELVYKSHGGRVDYLRITEMFIPAVKDSDIPALDDEEVMQDAMKPGR